MKKSEIKTTGKTQKELDKGFEQFRKSLPHNAKKVKKLRYLCSPELTDGDHWVVFDDWTTVEKSIAAWRAEFGDDSENEFSVRTILMSDEEVDELVEI